MADKLKIVKCKECGFKGQMICTETFDGDVCSCPK